MMFWPEQVQAGYHVHASGDFYTWDNGNLVPLKFARVEIMDSDSDTDTILDDTLGTGNTDQNGHYEIDGYGGDGGSYWWSKPDVYARVDLSDDYPRTLPPAYNGQPHPVRCTDELNSARGKDTPEHDHDNVSGNVTLGAFVWGDKNQSTAPSVWLNAKAVFEDYINVTGTIPPAGHYDIEYWSGIWSGTPWSNLDTTHWPRHYPTYGGTSMHEFAHTVRHSFDGDQNHFNWDVTRFVYARYHDHCDHSNRGFAFNEGWAEYWAGDTSPCNTPLNSEVEGDVAYALNQLEQCKERDTPGFVGKAGMVRVLELHPYAIHSIEQFQAAYSKEFPTACVGVLQQPEEVSHNKPPYPRVAWEDQVTFVQNEIAAQTRVVADLKEKLKAAMTDARRTRVVCEDTNCYAIFHTLIKPHLMQATIQTRLLAISRLKNEIRDNEQVAKRLNDGSFTAWYAKRKTDYMRAIWNANLPYLRDALKAVGPMEKSETGALLVRKLRTKLDKLEASFSAGETPPLGMQPSFLTDEKLEKIAMPNR